MSGRPAGVGAVMSRLAAVAAEAPDRIAVVDGDRRVSYAELMAAAHEVADRLPAGAGPLVGVGSSRGWPAIAAIIGVLMTGRAYVPVDQSYPEARRRYIETDAQLSHVITDDGVIVVADRPTVTSDVPADALYVIYTSGTTGDPKGVVVGHQNLIALLDGAFAALPLRPGLRWSVFHSLSFDFSVWEIWGPLLSGGCAVLIDRRTAVDPERVLALLSEERVQVLSVVPSGFNGLVSAAVRAHRSLPELEVVVLGGEAVRGNDVERWWAGRVAPASAVVNMYGITETTVHVTACRLTPELLAGSVPGRTPIGQPLPHLEVWVSTDGGRTRCPDGEPGEMIVVGAGVSAGYLGRPQLTAERFPLVDGQPAYRSGDWAVRSPADGSLSYVGRMDGQVKIRGHRIELGEVEASLARHPDVLAAACFVHREAGRPDRLFACVIGQAGHPDVRALRGWLADQVPAYLLPARIFAVATLPTTVTGKLDRAGLADLIASPQRRSEA